MAAIRVTTVHHSVDGVARVIIEHHGVGDDADATLNVL